MMVEAQVTTSASIIATMPFHFDNSIMVANCMSPVIDDKVRVLLLDLDTWDIHINKKQQIASFQAINEESKGHTTWGVGNVLPLGDTSSFVQVGEGLTAEERES